MTFTHARGRISILWAFALFFSVLAPVSEATISWSREDQAGAVSRLRYFVLGRQGLNEKLLRHTLINRCQTWLDYPESRCQEIFAAYWRNLSLRSFHGVERDSDRRISGLVIVFSDELSSYLEKPALDGFLEELGHELQNSPDFDLWNYFERAYVDPEKRLSFVASLFQDTSIAKATLHFYENHPNEKISDEVFLSYEKTISAFQDRVSGRQSSSQNLQLYPSQVISKSNGPTSQNLYHFYVPAYLVQKLLKSGLSSEEAVVMPLLLSFAYEMSAENWKASVGTGRKHRFGRAALDDLYLAYLGAHFAVYGDVSPKISRLLFSRIFSEEPDVGFNIMLRAFR